MDPLPSQWIKGVGPLKTLGVFVANTTTALRRLVYKQKCKKHQLYKFRALFFSHVIFVGPKTPDTITIHVQIYIVYPSLAYIVLQVILFVSKVKKFIVDLFYWSSTN